MKPDPDNKDLLSGLPEPEIRPRLKPLRQPDGISCGATAVSMVLTALGAMPEGGIKSMVDIIGTNPRTGTIPWAVVQGLDAMGVTARYVPNVKDGKRVSTVSSRLFSALRGKEGHPDFVLLRILAGGHSKHWIVAESLEGKKVRLLDPASGAAWRGNLEDLERDWGSRGYQAILISSDPREHKFRPHPTGLPPVTSSRLPNPLETPLGAWVACRPSALTGYSCIIIPERAYGASELNVIKHANDELEKANCDPYLAMLPVQSSELPGHRFMVEGGHFNETMVVRDHEGKMVGGIINGLTWIAPDERGRGLGSEMLLVAAANTRHEFLHPISFSMDGYRTRLSAHLKAVTRAMNAGVELPLGITADYERNAAGRVGRSETFWDDAIEYTGRQFNSVSFRTERRFRERAPWITAPDHDHEPNMFWPLLSKRN